MPTAYVQVQFRLDFFMVANNMSPDQTAPLEAQRSSLTNVHIVCNIGYLRTYGDAINRRQKVWLTGY